MPDWLGPRSPKFFSCQAEEAGGEAIGGVKLIGTPYNFFYTGRPPPTLLGGCVSHAVFIHPFDDPGGTSDSSAHFFLIAYPPRVRTNKKFVRVSEKWRGLRDPVRCGKHGCWHRH